LRNSILNIAEEEISIFEDISIETIQSEAEKTLNMKLASLSYRTTLPSVCVIGVPKRVWGTEVAGLEKYVKK
jgi:hypothetical protein